MYYCQDPQEVQVGFSRRARDRQRGGDQTILPRSADGGAGFGVHGRIPPSAVLFQRPNGKPVAQVEEWRRVIISVASPQEVCHTSVATTQEIL
jgi:hypothetical protein